MSTHTSQGLILEDIELRYGSNTAVNGVSLHLEKGQTLAVLGASGCGKTSLLRAVVGLEKTSRGRVAWDGEDLAHVPVHLRGFGLMFQEGQLFSHRNVAGNVAYGLHKIMNREEQKARVKELLDMVGLPGFEDRAVQTLSGGQAQRVALARALASRPKLLLLDEPLSALDTHLKAQLSSLLREVLTKSKTTALYVTHDQDEAFAVADHIGVMIDGKLAALDTPHNLWKNPVTQEVAEFLGYGPFLDQESCLRLGIVLSRDMSPQERLALGPLAIKPCNHEGQASCVRTRIFKKETGKGYTMLSLTPYEMSDVVFTVNENLNSQAPLHPGQNMFIHIDTEACCTVLSTVEKQIPNTSR
ncbi:MAG: ABC transporter ATP-binding protein [Actinomycetaceae bacterium]|nr:ABC transporter ATP-binding protein [Actinomycetaceae bacterium]